MNERSDDEDKDVGATTISKSPNRKIRSLNNEICHGPGPGTMTGGKKAQQVRLHSLDEERMSSADGDPSSIANARYDHSMSLPITTASGGATTTSATEDGASIPEYTAAGGTGIFKPPTRSAVHPGRPPALELRPHPLRETQVGKFLRTIGCTETQLWAGQESGVRFWNIKDAFEPGSGLGGKVRRGDEDAAPFYESMNSSPTNCMMVDHGNRLVWTGHKDGKIRSWKMDQNVSDDATPFREGLSWQGHKGPILAMAMSCYGDMWAGSEGGMIKMWLWESIEKSLSLTSEEKHMAALLVERAQVDLRAQVTVNGVCSISSSDVKVMLSDYSRGRMWCATSMSFSLWDARTRELVKVFNIDGQIENRVEMPVPSDQPIEEEPPKVKLSSSSKKEKSQGFLQRSRNALMGAADAVRRAASRGTNAFNEEHKKTEAMVLTADGTIWSGCSNGLLVQWDWTGNRLQDFNHNSSPILCFCTQGSRLWVGYASGLLQLLDLDGNLITGWVAHSSPNIKLGIGGGYIFSMAIHGGIRAWHLSSPGPIDNILRTELAAKEALYTRRESVKILIGTWNVGQGKAPHDGLKTWLGSVVGDIGIVVVGLQEVEMGAGFLAMSAAKETVGLEGSAMGQHWQDAIGRVIEEGLLFERVGSRQLASLLIAIWVRKTLRPHVGDLDVSAVACGLGRTIGNKGGVGLRLRVHDRIITFVNCHLAAHLEAVNRRNADFNHIYRTMVFSRQSHLLNVAAAGATSSSTGQNRNPNSANGNSEEGGKLDLSEADMVVFSGDFNYRLFGISYDEARDFVSQRSFDWLREKDQLREEMKQGRVFMGMREAVITFPPTYKFEKYVPGLGGYDSGEKKRIPAWCDRVIYRDCTTVPVEHCSLDCPIVAAVKMYEACMDVNDSDHKPVRCKISVKIARVDRSVRRKEFGVIMNNNQEIKKLLREYLEVPETTVSTNEIVLRNQDPCILQISNQSQKDNAVIHIVCDGLLTVTENTESSIRPRGSLGFPPWLEVIPSCGVIKPEETVEFSLGVSDQPVDKGGSCASKYDDKPKEAVLTVQVRGGSSLGSKTHQIRIRNCCSKLRMDSRSNSSKRGNDGSQHWSETQPDNNSETSDQR